jgi:hypothetical protein
MLPHANHAPPGASIVNNRRWAVAGLAVVASLTFATAGCGTATGNPGEAGGAPADTRSPEEALLASVEGLKTQPFHNKTTLTEGITFEATVDPVAKACTTKLAASLGSVYIAVEQLKFANESYAKVNSKNVDALEKVPSTWMKLDLAKIKEPNAYRVLDPDPMSLAERVIPATSNVERYGNYGFKGTVDLNKALKSRFVDDDTAKELGDKASAVPFEASVDAEGRIEVFKILVPTEGAVKAQTWVSRYYEYGKPVTITKPANSIVPPAAAYTFFNA